MLMALWSHVGVVAGEARAGVRQSAATAPGRARPLAAPVEVCRAVTGIALTFTIEDVRRANAALRVGVTEGCEVQAGAPSVDAIGSRVHPQAGSTLNYLAKVQAAAPGALRLPVGGWQLPQAYRSAAERRAVDDGAAVRGQRGLPVPGIAGGRGAAGQAA